MGYQLWLAERAVHASLLWAVRGRTRHRLLVEQILYALADRYLRYPNADNVLGPTRPFFSTYLESVWLLQLAVALDIVERVEGRSSFGDVVRERLLEPSADLIASFDEGKSNRQVWNSAALAAVGRLAERDALVDEAIFGRSGLVAFLERGLLADGTWYEGENYHLFAHRGLWYLMAIAEQSGATLPLNFVRRFEEGFAAPFLTALPDFTFPARRDSPYGVSLRQWRVAESCELGCARTPHDDRLLGALAELYRDDVGAGDPGRWRSTAEAERNHPPVRLTRADLGWKSLVAALPELPALPPLRARTPRSTLLEGQGFAVLRRRDGSVYVGLDYGHAGGGHGHPDRLNLWLVSGTHRVLEDPGTGSYVDRSLYWYRSTLAHNAPLADGRSQDRVDGELLAWDEQGDLGWIEAQAPIALDVIVRRAVVVTDEYLVDSVEWSCPRELTLDLPFHASFDLTNAPEWRAAPLKGNAAVEDGFEFVEEAACAGHLACASLVGESMRAWIMADEPHEWWRCTAPGPPGTERAPFFLLRARRSSGRALGVWSWNSSVVSVTHRDASVLVHRDDGTVEAHCREGDGWKVEHEGPGEHTTRILDGTRKRIGSRPAATTSQSSEIDSLWTIPFLKQAPLAVGELTVGSSDGTRVAPLQFRLSRQHYRQSESSWDEAGSPEALVALAVTSTDLFVEVSVQKQHPTFAPPRSTNPLDNEHPDINSDGIQLFLRADGNAQRHHHSWIIVPETGSPATRIDERIQEGGSVDISGAWRITPHGYQVLLRVPRDTTGLTNERVSLDVIVNEISPDRERRRGQLALSGGFGEWIYLRGDRTEPERYLTFRLANG
jgi:hypothetical protein